jgi:hypothetical protein
MTNTIYAQDSGEAGGPVYGNPGYNYGPQGPGPQNGEYGSEAGVGPTIPQASDRWRAREMWFGNQMTRYQQSLLNVEMQDYYNRAGRIEAERDAVRQIMRERRLNNLRDQCGLDDSNLSPSDQSMCDDLENNVRFGMPMPGDQ